MLPPSHGEPQVQTNARVGINSAAQNVTDVSDLVALSHFICLTPSGLQVELLGEQYLQGAVGLCVRAWVEEYQPAVCQECVI